METELTSVSGGDAAAIIENTRRDALAAAGAETIAPDVIARVVPDGYRLDITDVERYQDRPRRRVARVEIGTVESFVDYLEVHEEDGTRLYANPKALTVQAVLDDDAHRDHRALLVLARTQACERWFDAHAAYMQQEAFAQLVEDGLGEIASPAGADLLELAQSMHASSSAQFRSGLRLQDGRVQFSYVEELDARAGADGQMTIPETITLVFAPFDGAADMQIDARLRYRIAQGKLTLGVWLINGQETLRQAFDDELARIEALTASQCEKAHRPLIGSSGLS